MTEKRTEITIYTDGACSGNPGPGGYGIIILSEKKRQELSGGYKLTTNNRMELMAVIVGLEQLEIPSIVNLYTDSKYIVDAVTKGWAKRWRANSWKRNKKDKAMNPDLWGKLLDLCSKHQVEFSWVRGHSGNIENERCDKLAVKASQKLDLPSDLGYQ
ncbi:RNase HI [Trichodesmium erythraeum IMS101]|uniref:Ribonuclease H n=1 Tax=Trichodesmium erythraeum (strain IMS101) TaxID=203124 RepID=RNH_TRIEI|nr:RecName: Full=Ribonuclease H; Short=RNase H [Trichodesmium erythraeum IMS101]MBS9772393.1 ribonuclease HI [Trichodesmium erythraeum GBRTRLIN201]MCH2048920.1 ribonuclease HI [Trichodesmium sp. ALOHA_ZT_67]MDT9341664.1 ribonuclease HI [Trichodesmium erythraeum 21-75]